jgi:quercetin dioxygenase-like cupin family protein
MSHAIVKTDRFETIRLALPAGQSIPSHSVDGPVTIHCVTGRVNVSVEGRDNEMTPGTWMYLEGGIAHAVEAREESVVLLTIIF